MSDREHHRAETADDTSADAPSDSDSDGAGTESPRRRARRRRAAAAQRREAYSAPAPGAPVGWRDPHRWLGVSGTVLILGLVLIGLGPSELGSALTMLGAVAFLYSVHKYGRLGPEGAK